MFNLMNLMETYWIATVISVFLGFGIAAIFRPLCKGPDCKIIRGPPVGDIRGAVYQYGNKCIQFDAKPVECPKAGPTVNIVETINFAELV